MEYSYDGQAGAAGITLEHRTAETEANLVKDLYKFLRSQGVPTYAIPRLIRITKEYATPCSPVLIHSDRPNKELIISLHYRVATGVTFKQAKGDLSKRGWNPDSDLKGDTLYWLNSTGKQPKFELLDTNSWHEIESGRAKL